MIFGETLLAVLVAGVSPPPVAGRPAEFIQAVGVFRLHGSIEPQTFTLDQTAILTLEITGDGDHASIRPPALERQSTFTSRFRIVAPIIREKRPQSTIFLYPVRVMNAGVDHVPPLLAAIYDPRPPRPGYRMLRTSTLPIRIQPSDAAPPTLHATVPKFEDSELSTRMQPWLESAFSTLSTATLAATFVAATLVAVVWRFRPKSLHSRLGMEILPASVSMPDHRMKDCDSPAEVSFHRFADLLELPSGGRTSREVLSAFTTRVGMGPIATELAEKLSRRDAARFAPPDRRPHDGCIVAFEKEIAELTRYSTAAFSSGSSID